jgi:hypothetical protein
MLGRHAPRWSTCILIKGKRSCFSGLFQVRNHITPDYLLYYLESISILFSIHKRKSTISIEYLINDYRFHFLFEFGFVRIIGNNLP